MNVMNLQCGPDSAIAEVVEELIDKLQAGESDVEAFIAEHPEHEKALRRLLPALQVMAELSQSRNSAEGAESGDCVAGPYRTPLPSGEGGERSSPGEGLHAGALGDLGDYRILREVGRGGMGIVYEAEQLSLRRRVALKVLPFASALDPRQLQRFQNEALAAASLHHEHIIPVFAVGCERGVHFYAMQFIDGCTLADVIAELGKQVTGGNRRNREEERTKRKEGNEGHSTEGSKDSKDSERTSDSLLPSLPSVPSAASPFPLLARVQSVPADAAETKAIAALSTERMKDKRAFFRRAAELIAQAAEALEHAHSVGIVHRDIKPENLLVDRAGKLLVGDFGLARFGTDAGLTMTGDLLGTLRYMAPEQALAKHGLVDHRADIYALGATLYELLTLRPAVAAAERAEILRQIAFDEPTPLRKCDKNIPAELETITLKCLSKTPADRYGTTGELADDLRMFLDNQPIKARPPTLIERARRWSQRHVAAVTAAASSSIIALSIGLVAVTIAQLRTQRAYTDLAREKERTRAAADSAVAARTREAAQRKRAEDHLEVARRAVNEMYSEVAEKWLEDESEMEGTQRSFLLKAVAFYEQLAEQPTADPAMRYESARAWHRAGRIHRKLGEAATAEQCLTRSLALLKQLTSECPSQGDYQWSLVSCEIQMGGLLDRARRFEEAERHLRQALDLIHRLGSPSPADGTYLHYLSSLKALANCLSHAGKQTEADPIYDRLLTLSDDWLAAVPRDPDRLHEAAHSYHNRAYSLSIEAKTEESLALIRQAIDYDRRAIDIDPRKHAYWDSLANHYHSLAVAMRLLLRPKDEEQAHHDEFKHLQKLVSEFPSIPEYRFRLANNRAQLGNFLESTRRRSQAEPVHRQAVEQLRILVSRFSESFEYRHLLGNELHNVAHIDLILGRDVLEAIGLFESAIEHQEFALKLNPAATLARKSLCSHYCDLAQCLANTSDIPRRDPLRAAQLARKAIAVDSDFAFAHACLGYALYRSGQWEAAASHSQRALDLGLPHNQWDEAETRFILSMAQWQFGAKDDALKTYHEAVTWIDGRGMEKDGPYPFRVEATSVLGVVDKNQGASRHEINGE